MLNVKRATGSLNFIRIRCRLSVFCVGFLVGYRAGFKLAASSACKHILESLRHGDVIRHSLLSRILQEGFFESSLCV